MVRVLVGEQPDDVALATDAVEVAGQLGIEEADFWRRRMVSLVNHCAARADDPSHLVALCAQVLAHSMERSGYAESCPVVITAHGITPTAMLRTACGRVFRGWQEALRHQFALAGLGDERAGSLASITVSVLEGALVLSRTRMTTQPLKIAGRELANLVGAEFDEHPSTSSRRLGRRPPVPRRQERSHPV